MKVLIATNNDIGLYKFRRELVEELLKSNEVYLSLPYGTYVDYFIQNGCKYFDCELDRHGMNPINELKLIRYYKKILKEINPDIVFTYTIKPNIYGGMACASLNIPYVVNITGLGTAVENKGLLQLITVGLYRVALRKAQTIFFQNTENEQFFTNKKLALGKHKMLPGSGVNLEYYNPLEYPGDETIEFAFVARIMKEKGIEQYLEAAKEIRKKYPNTRFHVCGFCEQAYEDEIRRLNEENTIIYHGLVKDMRDIYRKVHCVVHPTYYPEGLSNVLLEASASARPIITTNRSGCREVLENSRNGFLVKECDSRDVIDKLEKFIKLSWEEKKQMGVEGRKKVEDEFDRQTVTGKYIAEINTCKNSL